MLVQKTIYVQKNLRPRSVGSQKKFGYKTKVRSQKVLAQKIKIKKNKSNKTLGPEKFGVQPILGTKFLGKMIWF